MPATHFVAEPSRGDARRRRGVTAVYCSLVLLFLLGMCGLTVDGGRMLSGRRSAQNASDAAALAAAMEKYRGETNAAAVAAAVSYVQAHNNLAEADVVVNIPPQQGAYSGNSNFIEVLVTNPVPTYFIHALPGVEAGQQVRARAVAGLEPVAVGEGAIVLDPTARPGLNVSGQGRLVVQGTVRVNSEGGGVDENGNPSLTQQNGASQWAAVGGQPNSPNGIYAEDILVVGGVQDPGVFKHVDPSVDESPLRCNSPPLPDPMAMLPTPSVANGVIDDAVRRAVRVTNNSTQDVPSDWIDDDGVVWLKPRVYESITITGGDVRLEPGIYVVAGGGNNNRSISITGGTVIGEGVLLYLTGEDYDPLTGTPDTSDPYDPLGHFPPAGSSSSNFGTVEINAAVQLSPIDTHNPAFDYSEAAASIADFNGILFYQRRMNSRSITITGNASEGVLSGALYAKWSNVQITGQGTYDARFIVGSIDIPGQGRVTIHATGAVPETIVEQPFLVE